MRKLDRAIALIDVCIVVSIVSILAVLGVPALMSTRKAANVAHALSNLREIQRALAIYREAYSDAQTYGLAREMGIPSTQQIYLSDPYQLNLLFPKTKNLWTSPCGNHSEAPGSPTTTTLGWLPSDFEDEPWFDYVHVFQDKAVFIIDSNCNDHSKSLHLLDHTYLNLGVTLEGTIRRKMTSGTSTGALAFFQEIETRQ